MIHMLHAFLDFCYLACHSILDTQSLAAMQDALNHFHQYWEIFCTCGICSPFNLPCQHLLTHFIQMIQAFCAPNGLCSSITEFKYIKAVKKPYWTSSHYEALGQMLLTTQCLDQLTAVQVDFQRCGMLNGTCLLHTLWLVYQLGEEDETVAGDEGDKMTMVMMKVMTTVTTMMMMGVTMMMTMKTLMTGLHQCLLMSP